VLAASEEAIARYTQNTHPELGFESHQVTPMDLNCKLAVTAYHNKHMYSTMHMPQDDQC
jgi:hypothetical protein